ncbi:hypothetical protein C5C52_03210 [Rathayibacter sp. AY1E5]|nr:hypothetical protein C5C52_03210 [Rathayibacter sp. AY1E5]
MRTEALDAAPVPITVIAVAVKVQVEPMASLVNSCDREEEGTTVVHDPLPATSVPSHETR